MTTVRKKEFGRGRRRRRKKQGRDEQGVVKSGGRHGKLEKQKGGT